MSLFEFFGELEFGKARSREQHHVFIVLLPVVNTKGSGQEVGGDVAFARDVSKFEVEFC